MSYPGNVHSLRDLYNVFKDAPNRERLILDMNSQLARIDNIAQILTMTEEQEKEVIAKMSASLANLGLNMDNAIRELKNMETVHMDRVSVLTVYQSAVLNITNNTHTISDSMKSIMYDLSGYVNTTIYPTIQSPATEDRSSLIPLNYKNMKNIFDDKHTIVFATVIGPQCVDFTTEDVTNISWIVDSHEIIKITYYPSSLIMETSIVGNRYLQYQLSLSNQTIDEYDNNGPYSCLLVFCVVGANGLLDIYSMSSQQVRKYVNDYEVGESSLIGYSTKHGSLHLSSNDIRNISHELSGSPYIDVRVTYSITAAFPDSQLLSMLLDNIQQSLGTLTACESKSFDDAYRAAMDNQFTKADVLTSSIITMRSSLNSLISSSPLLSDDTIRIVDDCTFQLASALTLTNEFASDSANLLGTFKVKQTTIDRYSNTKISEGKAVYLSPTLATMNVHSGSVVVSTDSFHNNNALKVMLLAPGLVKPDNVNFDLLSVKSNNVIDLVSDYKLDDAIIQFTDQPDYSSTTSIANAKSVVYMKTTGCIGLTYSNPNELILNMSLQLNSAAPSLGGVVNNNTTFSLTIGSTIINYVTDFEITDFTDSSGKQSLKLTSSVNLLTKLSVDMIFYAVSINAGGVIATDTHKYTDTGFDSSNYTYGWEMYDSAALNDYQDMTVVTPPKFTAKMLRPQDASKLNGDCVGGTYKKGRNILVIAGNRIFYNGVSVYFKMQKNSMISLKYFINPSGLSTVDTCDVRITRNAAFLTQIDTKLMSVQSVLNDVQRRIDIINQLMQPSRIQTLATIIQGIGGVVSLAMPLLGAIVVTIGAIVSIADPNHHGVDYQAVLNAFHSWCQYAVVARMNYGLLKADDPKLDILKRISDGSVNTFRNKPKKITLPGIDDEVIRGTSTDYIDTGINVRYNSMGLFGEGKLEEWMANTALKVQDGTANIFQKNLFSLLQKRKIVPMHARVEIIQTEKIGDVYRNTILYAGINEGSYIENSVYLTRSGNTRIKRLNMTSGPGMFKAVTESTTEVGNFKAVDWTLSGMTKEEIYNAAGLMYPNKNPAHSEVQDVYESVIRDMAEIDDTWVLQHHKTVMLPGQIEAFEHLIRVSANKFQYAFIGSNCQNFADDVVGILSQFKRPKRWVDENDFKQYIQSIYDEL
ncbi:RGDV P2 [Rice gall dwarf virus]|uniref:Minor outer capsid protein P2 n=1 Tax=Rice gall dwarf virus TaxID=10986 RepID=P2_RGDV|nr:RGDV P2 [Rice gall dwarf virus]O56834.1 RecName: Full=Minor outer capsid protein P2 [Rice gall dwarf virus]BAA24136.1 RGDV P2 [Rice gall dwarf virus]